MRKILPLLMLTSCAPYMVHQPDLAAVPTDENQYSSDLNSCRHEVFDKRGPDWGQGAAISGFGLVGEAAYGHNPAFDQVDDCLRKKGYRIN